MSGAAALHFPGGEGLPAALPSTLAMVAGALAGAQEPWWVIGSAAVALHGADPGAIADVDVLLAEADSRRILPALGLAATPGVSDGRFVSELFARWDAPPLEVEFMAGLQLCQSGEWSRVVPQSRIAATGKDWTVYMPDRAELVAILHRFGRAKDLARAEALARAR